MPKTALRIGPQDDGRRMRLKDFEHATGQEGYLYELSRGVVTVMNVPKLRHALQVDATNDQFRSYRVANTEQIFLIAGGSDCKILIAGYESERHPDLAIYLTPPPEDDDVWPTWIPDILIEIVSRSSRKRDYVEKLEEYLAFGVREYWILDADREVMHVYTRSRGEWVKQVVRPPKVYRTPLLPGFEFRCAAVFGAAKKAKE